MRKNNTHWEKRAIHTFFWRTSYYTLTSTPLLHMFLGWTPAFQTGMCESCLWWSSAATPDPQIIPMVTYTEILLCCSEFCWTLWCHGSAFLLCCFLKWPGGTPFTPFGESTCGPSLHVHSPLEQKKLLRPLWIGRAALGGRLKPPLLFQSKSGPRMLGNWVPMENSQLLFDCKS